MRAELIAILIAVLSGSGIPLWFLNKFDKRNTDQHNANMEILTEARNDIRDVKTEVRDVKEDVRDVRDEVRGHIRYHKEIEGGTTGRDTGV